MTFQENNEIEEEKQTLKEFSTFLPNNGKPDDNSNYFKTLSPQKISEINQIIHHSEQLMQKVKKQPVKMQSVSAQDVQQLENLDYVDKILASQAKIKKDAMLVKSDLQLEELRKRSFQQIEVANIASEVGKSVTMKRANVSSNQIEQLNIQIQNKQISPAGAQILIGQVPEQDINNINLAVSQNIDFSLQQDFSAANYQDLHLQQMQTIQNLPIKEFELPPFYEENGERYQKLAKMQLFEQFFNSIPSSLYAHLPNQQQFEQYLKNGSLATYYSVVEMASLIKNSGTECKLQEIDNIKEYDADFYIQLYQQLKKKYGESTVFHKDQVEKDCDYKINELDIKNVLEMLNNRYYDEFKQIQPNKVIVDELGKVAKLYGHAYSDKFQQLENQLQLDREYILSEISNKINFNQDMHRESLKHQTKIEKQILKHIQSADEVIQHTPQAHLTETTQLIDQQFLLQFYQKFIENDNLEIPKQDRIQICLQNVYTMCQMRIFRHPDEQLEYHKNETIDEDMVVNNISLELIQPVEPNTNEELQKYLEIKGIKEGLPSNAQILQKVYNQCKISLIDQIEVFDYMISHQDSIEKVVAGINMFGEYISSNDVQGAQLQLDNLQQLGLNISFKKAFECVTQVNSLKTSQSNSRVNMQVL